jgi:hypothetical protein
MLISLGALLVLLTAGASWPIAQGSTMTDPELTSAGPLAFGLEGTLFIADNMGATIFALELESQLPNGTPGTKAIERIDHTIAAMLGTGAEQIQINDLAVSPTSKNTFLSVSRGTGSQAIPMLMRVDGAGTLDLIALDSVTYTRTDILNAPESNVEVRRGPNGEVRMRPVYAPAANARMDTVTDMSFVNGRLLVAGLSNEEFASKVRSIPYPFSEVESETSVEIWHASHGEFETRAPIYTFVEYELNGEQNLIAGYFCTPLVKFAVEDLYVGTPNGKVRGTTIAEMGAFNRPLDMIVYEKESETFLLTATVSKGVLKMAMADVASQTPVTRQVPEMEDVAGVPFETITEMEGTLQLDRLNEMEAVFILRTADGAANLEVKALP